MNRGQTLLQIAHNNDNHDDDDEKEGGEEGGMLAIIHKIERISKVFGT